MICKYCNLETPDDSVFCCHCGERLARKKRDKKKELSVPEPRQLPSGAWNIQLRKEEASVTEATKDACIAKARAIRAGFLKQEKTPPKRSLENVIRTFIDDNEPVLSVDTVRSYESMLRNRFPDYMQQDVAAIDWQRMVSKESEKLAPKTVTNAWRLVTAAMGYAKLPVPDINLPQLVQEETPWLDYEQIQVFLDGIKGKSCERACLLALHSLRISEIRALKTSSIKDGVIHVRGAVVPNKNQQYVEKPTNKNDTSRRDIPVMIPRLLEIWPSEGEALTFQTPSPLRRMIARTCEQNGLPVVTIHGLRHSFASLAYHLKWDVRTTCTVGGWSDTTCVQRIYTHLSAKDKNKDIQRMIEFYSPQITNEIANGN